MRYIGQMEGHLVVTPWCIDAINWAHLTLSISHSPWLPI